MSQDREQRAIHAHQLLEDYLLTESMDAMKAIYVKALRQCNAKDDLGRFRYAVALDVIDGMRSHLEAVLVQGKLNPKQGQEFQTPQKILRIF